MPEIGQTIAHYRILERIGHGGMGEVYLAEDLSLDRKVALKFLPDVFAGDPERMARFEREAKLLASLNHPNIAGIYGLEQADGKRFLVLEYVKGETLQARLSKGALPLEDALVLCRQIAEGLEAAHEKGIIHRDLKPANVMITAEEKVKILDFGLAKALADEIQSVDLSQSPTITEAMTQPGVVLGTAAYMSPEQAKGKSVDKRADVWAFGCILYECLAGERAFSGKTVTETLAAILKGEPDWDALPPNASPGIRFVLHRCLEKDMSRRFRNTIDVRIMVEEAGSPFFPGEARVLVRPFWKTAAFVLIGLILAAALGGVALWSLRSPAPAKVVRFSLDLPADQSFTSPYRRVVAISPDGANFVYAANGQIYLRRLAEPEARPLPGTQESAANPFFSPDGKWIGFYSNQDGALKKIPVAGGTAVMLCRVPNPLGVSWQGDTIVFAQGSNGILAIPAMGGKADVWVKLEPGESASGPQVLPGGNDILFAVTKSQPNIGGSLSESGWDSADIVVYTRKTGKRKVLIQGGSGPRYVSTGHILYAHGNDLLMVPIDLARLEVTGSAVTVMEGVARVGSLASAMVSMPNISGEGNFDFSTEGTLVYIPGTSDTMNRTDRRVLATIDRDGKKNVLGLPPGSYESPRLSPDGKQLALITNDDGGTVWIYDMSGRSALRRLTSEGPNSFPVWSPDGRQLAFYSYRENRPGIFLRAADGTGAAERLAGLPDADGYIPNAWSPDGKTLAFTVNKAGDYGIWTVPITGDRKAQVFADLPGSTQAHAAFSPNGNWIAYMSGERSSQEASGSVNIYNIYVQPFPKIGAAKYQISRAGTNDVPVWSHDGKELFYCDLGPQKLVAVSIRTQPSFAFVQSVTLPIEGIVQSAGGRQYDIMPDGRGFLVMLPETQTKGQLHRDLRINIVLNWFEELSRKQGK